MLRLLDPGGGVRLCDGWSRREVLRVGGLGVLGSGLGLGLPGLLRSEARGAPVPGGRTKARSCVVLFLMGGPPQHATWDPKPDAPPEVRGPFGPIATSVPGISVCELWPHTARVMDRVCLLRAVSTGDNAHSSSGYYMLTGRPHAPMNFENANPGPPNDWPTLGALLGQFAPEGSDAALPPSVILPHRVVNTDGSVWPGQDAGFLGRARDPWLLNARLSPEGYRVQEIDLPAELDPARLDRRKGLLDRLVRGLDHAEARASTLDAHTRRAFDLLRSGRARDAFRLDRETPAVHERYGRTPFGQGVLLARRLVEAGVRLVQVNWYRGPDEPPANPCWDSHSNEPQRLKEVLAPPADRAFAALVGDLAERGLLDETLVVCMAEFGRTPRLDAGGGRGHWGSVFSIALAGGGVAGGRVYGASDKIGAYPKEGRVRPEDLVATFAHCLGVDPRAEYPDPLGRPHVVSRGEVLHPILA